MAASGAALIYTGYAWRGRSTVENAGAGPEDRKTMREVMMLSKDQSEFKGRWFWGEYQEFGMDVTMRRATGPEPALMLLRSRPALTTPRCASMATIYRPI